MKRFANPEVVCEGWYPIGRARAIRRGRIQRVSVGKREIALYRDSGGELHSPCAVRERWGVAWVWAGDVPAYDLPMPEPENRAHVLRLPMQRIACHPHVVLGNGLDISHVVGVHRFHFEGEPKLESDLHRVSLQVRAHFHPTLMRHILGLAHKSAQWRFTNIGPSLAWVKVESPTPFELVWAARPLPDGSCATQTLFFLPRWRSLARAVSMMVATTWADRRVLEGLDFLPGFVASDAVFARYAQLVEGLPEW